MKQHLSEQPTSLARRPRRSLAEFTLSAIPASVVEPFRPAQFKPLAPPPVAKLDRPTRLKITAKRKSPPVRVRKAVDEISPVAADMALPAETLPVETKVEEESEQNKLFGAVHEVAAVAAKAAKDYRAWFLENMKSNMAAGLGYAGGLANPVADSGQKNADGSSESEQNLSASTRVATEFYNKAFALMTANLDAAVDYAQRLGDVTSPSEFIALSTSHARRHAELVITQAAALGTFSQEYAETSAEQASAELSKAFDRKP